MSLSGNVRIVTRDPEAPGVRELREMFSSREFETFLKRIDYMVTVELASCETAASVAEWRISQGVLKGLRAVKALPATLIAEAKAR